MDLTPGAIEVQDIRAIDHSYSRIYYLASGLGEPSQRNLYSVSADGSEKPTCISCNVLTPEGKFREREISYSSNLNDFILFFLFFFFFISPTTSYFKFNQSF